MDDEEHEPHEGDLVSRAPTEDDFVALCRRLNESGARYVIAGGFAMIYAGYGRTTGDLDLLIDPAVENEAKVFRALESLPDKAVLQLKPGEVEKYMVVRVADEISFGHRLCGGIQGFRGSGDSGRADSVRFTAPVVADEEEHASRER